MIPGKDAWFWFGYVAALAGGYFDGGLKHAASWSLAYVALNALLYSIGVAK